MNVSSSEEYFFSTLIDRREIDIGFPLQDRILRNVKVNQLFEEQMVLIQNKGNVVHELVIPNHKLDPRKQLYINWGVEYQIWHEKHWGPTVQTYIQIDTANMLIEFLTQADHWAIVPVSIARNFYLRGWVDILLLEDHPPKFHGTDEYG